VQWYEHLHAVEGKGKLFAGGELIWEGIMNALAAAHDGAMRMIDTSMVRVHQHAACIANSAGQAVGRSRGGLTSKLHVVVDGTGCHCDWE
jgi:hypothetical protein